MVLTFREIQRRVQARLSNTSTSTSEDNDLLPKIKDWINERYERIYDSYPWREVLEDTTMAMTSSVVTYALERDIGKVWAVFDQTNGRTIKQEGVQQYNRLRAIDLDQTGNVQTGDPRRYYPVGTFTVKAEIGSTAEKVDVVSSSTSDTSPNCVHIAGLVNGVELQEDITLTGTTTATSTNTYDANQKLRINVGTTTGVRKTIVGAITVDGNTSGTVFAVISPAEYAPMYRWINVSPTPKSSGTQPVWKLWYSKRIQLLDDDNDIPILDVGLALVEGAYAEGLREDGQDGQAQAAEARFAGIAAEKQAAQGDWNEIEQFIPDDRELVQTLDYGRTIIGGNE